MSEWKELAQALDRHSDCLSRRIEKLEQENAALKDEVDRHCNPSQRIRSRKTIGVWEKTAELKGFKVIQGGVPVGN